MLLVALLLSRQIISSSLLTFFLIYFFLTWEARYRKGAFHLVRLCLILANIQKIEKSCLKEKKPNGIKWSLKCQNKTWRQLLFHTTLTIRYQHFQSSPFQIEKDAFELRNSQANLYTCKLLPCSGSQVLRVYVGNINKLLQGKAQIALQSVIIKCSLFSFKCKADKYLQD